MYRKIPEKTTDIRRDKGSKIHFSVNVAVQSRKKLSETGKKYKTKKITDQILFTLKGVIIYNKSTYIQMQTGKFYEGKPQKRIERKGGLDGWTEQDQS